MLKQTINIETCYTSKCDSLSNESIEYHKIYNGKREKRGLFSSSLKKYINADINGAINIMRKVLNIKDIIHHNIYNPQRINIFREV